MAVRADHMPPSGNPSMMTEYASSRPSAVTTVPVSETVWSSEPVLARTTPAAEVPT